MLTFLTYDLKVRKVRILFPVSHFLLFFHHGV